MTVHIGTGTDPTEMNGITTGTKVLRGETVDTMAIMSGGIMAKGIIDASIVIETVW